MNFNDIVTSKSIHSSDVIDGYDDLEAEREELQEALDNAESDLEAARSDIDDANDGRGDEIDEALLHALNDAQATYDAAKLELETWDGEVGEHLKLLEDAADEVKSFEGWRGGFDLFNEADFKDHARDHAENLGIDICGWPYDSIDWDHAANELIHDYSSISIGNVTFYTMGD